MKNKRFNIFIIAALLTAMIFGFSGRQGLRIGTTVYAEDTDESQTADSEYIQLGDYKYKVIQKFDDQWPQSVEMNVKYERISEYPVWPYYIVNIDGNRQRVYQAPSKYSDGIDSLYYGERCKLLELIENDKGEQWYLFVTKISGEDAIGFIPTDKVELRQFRLEQMYNEVQTVAGINSMGPVVYIENYRDLNGIPPKLASGEYYDPYGYRRRQSAAGYNNKELVGDFRYIPDGTLCIVEEIVNITDISDENIMFNSMGEFVPAATDPNLPASPENIKKALDIYNAGNEAYATKVYVPSFGVSLWVDSVYIDMNKKMQGGFGQVIIIDRANQNIGAFEYDNGWKLISLSYSTTGKNTSTAVPTPLGYFMAIEKKDLFEYQEDSAYVNAGFAPYAIRFSGGGYIHGVPMNYEYDDKGKRKPIYTYDESILSIGTVPESHMCVRNFTSHAKFMYDWVAIGSCSVIVFE